MSYKCFDASSHVNIRFGSGQCVDFVRGCTGAPATGQWRRGLHVKGSSLIEAGTAIATFNAGGSYPSAATGNHAAIYDSQDLEGIWVYDQWVGQPVHLRRIRFKNGGGSASNDGDAFYVIE